MADLQTVESRIAELRAEIAPKLREIEVLESAARILRALDKGEPISQPAHRPFSELTMPEAAEQILLEVAPRSLHFRRITEIALARGFRGKRTDLNAPVDRIAASFRRMMGQQPGVFAAVGGGEYRITDDYLAKPSGP